MQIAVLVNKVLPLPWQEFAKRVTQLNEKEAWVLLEEEVIRNSRVSYAQRLYQHANKLRTLRQRAGLEKGELPGDRP